MDVQWSPGTQHHMPDALSRLPCFMEPGEDISDALPGDASTRGAYEGEEGPVLDGMLSSSSEQRRWARRKRGALW